MTEPARPRMFALLEAKFRQLTLMAGLGFLSLVAGAFISTSLLERVSGRLDPVEGGLFDRLALIAIRNAWALLVLPGVGWLTLRLLDMRPLTFALVASSTAFAFQLALTLVTDGMDALIVDPELIGVRLGSFAVAVALTTWAGRQARATAATVDAEAKVKAQATQTQYAEFAEQAKALAERREAQPISAVSAAVEADPTAATHGAAAPSQPPGPGPSIADAIAEVLATTPEPAPGPGQAATAAAAPDSGSGVPASDDPKP